MQVRDTPLRVNERGATVTLSVGAGGSGIYYGPSESSVKTNTAAPGAQVTITSPMYVQSQGLRDGPPADLDVLGGDTTLPSSGSSVHVPRQGYRLALLGDSIEGQHRDDTTAANSTFLSNGYAHLAQRMLGHPFSIVKVAATTGHTTDQFLARLGTDILGVTPKPDYCVVGGVENDSVSAALSIANLTSIYEQLIASGIQPIARTCLPYAGKNAAFRALRGAVNAWTKDYARQRGFPCFDAFPVIADPSTGDPKATLTRDSLVHINYNGASLVGKQMAAELAKWLRYTVALPEANDDGSNLVANGMMLGGTTTPTSWSWFSNGPTPTRSKVARTDVPGAEWFQVAIGATLAGNTFQLYQNISSGFAVGDKIVLKVEFQTDVDTLGSFQGLMPVVNFTGGNPFVPCTDVSYATGNGDTAPTADTFDLFERSGVMVSPVTTIPPGTTALQPMLQWGANSKGTWRIGRVEIRKVA